MVTYDQYFGGVDNLINNANINDNFDVQSFWSPAIEVPELLVNSILITDNNCKIDPNKIYKDESGRYSICSQPNFIYFITVFSNFINNINTGVQNVLNGLSVGLNLALERSVNELETLNNNNDRNLSEKIATLNIYIKRVGKNVQQLTRFRTNFEKLYTTDLGELTNIKTEIERLKTLFEAGIAKFATQTEVSNFINTQEFKQIVERYDLLSASEKKQVKQLLNASEKFEAYESSNIRKVMQINKQFFPLQQKWVDIYNQIVQNRRLTLGDNDNRTAISVLGFINNIRNTLSTNLTPNNENDFLVKIKKQYDIYEKEQAKQLLNQNINQQARVNARLPTLTELISNTPARDTNIFEKAFVLPRLYIAPSFSSVQRQQEPIPMEQQQQPQQFEPMDQFEPQQPEPIVQQVTFPPPPPLVLFKEKRKAETINFIRSKLKVNEGDPMKNDPYTQELVDNCINCTDNKPTTESLKCPLKLTIDFIQKTFENNITQSELIQTHETFIKGPYLNFLYKNKFVVPTSQICEYTDNALLNFYDRVLNRKLIYYDDITLFLKLTLKYEDTWYVTYLQDKSNMVPKRKDLNVQLVFDHHNKIIPLVYMEDRNNNIIIFTTSNTLPKYLNTRIIQPKIDKINIYYLNEFKQKFSTNILELLSFLVLKFDPNKANESGLYSVINPIYKLNDENLLIDLQTNKYQTNYSTFLNNEYKSIIYHLFQLYGNLSYLEMYFPDERKINEENTLIPFIKIYYRNNTKTNVAFLENNETLFILTNNVQLDDQAVSFEFEPNKTTFVPKYDMIKYVPKKQIVTDSNIQCIISLLQLITERSEDTKNITLTIIQDIIDQIISSNPSKRLKIATKLLFIYTLDDFNNFNSTEME